MIKLALIGMLAFGCPHPAWSAEPPAKFCFFWGSLTVQARIGYVMGVRAGSDGTVIPPKEAAVMAKSITEDCEKP